MTSFPLSAITLIGTVLIKVSTNDKSWVASCIATSLLSIPTFAFSCVVTALTVAKSASSTTIE